MQERPYDKVLLFMGVLSVKGFPEEMKVKLEEKFGPIEVMSEPFPFSFTDYYVPEMGDGIQRFFLAFNRLVSPDELVEAKKFTNSLEAEWEENGGRKINLDPGTLSEANIVLATTKNRAHRIAIGQNLFAELTLMYQNHGFVSFPWTYADYRSEEVQKTLIGFRTLFLSLRKKQK